MLKCESESCALPNGLAYLRPRLESIFQPELGTPRWSHNGLHKRSWPFVAASPFNNAGLCNMSLLESPFGELEHFDIQWVANNVTVYNLQGMARGKRVEEARAIAVGRQIVDIVDELTKAVHVAIEGSHTEDVQPILGECACFVKTAYVYLPSDIDARRRDAKDSKFAKASDRKICPDREGRRKSGWNYYRDQVESTDHDGRPFNLRPSE